MGVDTPHLPEKMDGVLDLDRLDARPDYGGRLLLQLMFPLPTSFTGNPSRF